MSANASSRRLAAILAADVVGYSRLIGADEPGTLAKLASVRSGVIDPQIAAHGGRVFKTTGDGLLAEFASGVQAVQCAIAIQQAMHRQEGIQLRIGLHSADVTVQPDGDLLGDGVNIAARLEALAEPGSICISGRVREDAAGKLSLEVEDLGEPELKNITQRHRVFRVRFGAPERPPLALPDKPSLAVLPFQNMSGDPEQEYFADGMVEEIITALSRFRQLFVIARNSSFTYKGRTVDVKQVGRELGVRYVLEGGVRKSGNRVRITGQLIDSSTGTHLWADRFDGTLDDIFDLQDQVTTNVVTAIVPTIRTVEIKRAKNKPTDNLQAYDLLLRAMPHHYSYTNAGLEEATRLLRRATELDPTYALAFARLAAAHYSQIAQGWLEPTASGLERVVQLTKLALELGGDDPEVLAYSAYFIGTPGGNLRGAIKLAEKALTLNPNSMIALLVLGYLHTHAGNNDTGVEYVEKAARFNPLEGETYRNNIAATAYFIAGHYEDAVEFAERAIRDNPNGVANLRYLAASLGLLGRIDEACEAVKRLLSISPNLTISRVRRFLEMDSPVGSKMREMLDAYCEGLRRAGLPE